MPVLVRPVARSAWVAIRPHGKRPREELELVADASLVPRPVPTGIPPVMGNDLAAIAEMDTLRPIPPVTTTQQRKRRKNMREQQRRKEINDRFTKLSQLVFGVEFSGRVDKTQILDKAIHIVTTAVAAGLGHASPPLDCEVQLGSDEDAENNPNACGEAQTEDGPPTLRSENTHLRIELHKVKAMLHLTERDRLLANALAFFPSLPPNPALGPNKDGVASGAPEGSLVAGNGGDENSDIKPALHDPQTQAATQAALAQAQWASASNLVPGGEEGNPNDFERSPEGVLPPAIQQAVAMAHAHAYNQQHMHAHSYNQQPGGPSGMPRPLFPQDYLQIPHVMQCGPVHGLPPHPALPPSLPHSLLQSMGANVLPPHVAPAPLPYPYPPAPSSLTALSLAALPDRTSPRVKLESQHTTTRIPSPPTIPQTYTDLETLTQTAAQTAPLALTSIPTPPALPSMQAQTSGPTAHTQTLTSTTEPPAIKTEAEAIKPEVDEGACLLLAQLLTRPSSSSPALPLPAPSATSSLPQSPTTGMRLALSAR